MYENGVGYGLWVSSFIISEFCNYLINLMFNEFTNLM